MRPLSDLGMQKHPVGGINGQLGVIFGVLLKSNAMQCEIIQPYALTQKLSDRIRDLAIGLGIYRSALKIISTHFLVEVSN